MVVEQVFNDAALISEFSVRDTLQKVTEERRFYMAACGALLKRLGGEALIFDTEFLVDRDISAEKSDSRQGILLRIVEERGLVEEVEEDQMTFHDMWGDD